MLTADPTASMATARREPLQLPLFGLSGSVSSLTIPDRYYGYSEKLPLQEGELTGTAYANICERIQETPYIDNQNPIYVDIYHKINVVRSTPQHFHTL